MFHNNGVVLSTQYRPLLIRNTPRPIRRPIIYRRVTRAPTTHVSRKAEFSQSTLEFFKWLCILLIITMTFWAQGGDI